MPLIDQVDPELLPQLEAPAATAVPISRETMGEVRALSEQRQKTKPVYGSTQSRKVTVEGRAGPVDLFIFETETTGKPKPCLLWLHGGGYIMGRAEDMWNGPLFAERAGCTVVSVKYRLAPEHPFPAGLEDAFAAMNWISDNAGTLNINPERIAVGGASAGAGLAAGLALYNRDRNGPQVAFQLLLYPMLDNLHDTPSGRLSDHPIWCRADSLAAWEMYLDGLPGTAASPYAAPARATEHSNLPPAFICVGEVDLFLDESQDYGRRLNKAGVDCEVKTYPGMFHGGEAAGSETAVGKRMIDDFVEALKMALT